MRSSSKIVTVQPRRGKQIVEYRRTCIADLMKKHRIRFLTNRREVHSPPRCASMCAASRTPPRWASGCLAAGGVAQDEFAVLRITARLVALEAGFRGDFAPDLLGKKIIHGGTSRPAIRLHLRAARPATQERRGREHARKRGPEVHHRGEPGTKTFFHQHNVLELAADAPRNHGESGPSGLIEARFPLLASAMFGFSSAGTYPNPCPCGAPGFPVRRKNSRS